MPANYRVGHDEYYDFSKKYESPEDLNEMEIRVSEKNVVRGKREMKERGKKKIP